MSRRVVITGIGLISPLGNAPAEFWSRLSAGESGISRLDAFPAEGLPIRFAGICREFTGAIDDYGPLDDARKRAVRKGGRLMCRDIEMGVASAQHALRDAGLPPGSYDSDRSGVVFGSDYIMTAPGEFTDGVRQCAGAPGEAMDFSRWGQEGIPKVTPLWLLKYLPNMPASHIAIYNDLRGPSNSLTHREASSNLCLGEAFHAISRGAAETMVAGATGSRIHPLRSVHVVLQEELASGDAGAECLPFDLRREGQVIGEGAGAFVLEEFETARRRGAEMHGELLAHGASTVRDRQGVADLRGAMRNAMIQALNSARLRADEIGHVHAHGLATRRSDRQEAAAIRDVFGPGRTVPVTAVKSYLGNLGAGGGAVELAASLLSMRDRRSIPLRNFRTPDPDCDLDLVLDAERDPGSTVLNLNVTPQGQASCVIARVFTK